MIKVLKYIASGWRGMLATAGFIAAAELWHQEECRLNGIRAARIAENIAKTASEGSNHG